MLLIYINLNKKSFKIPKGVNQNPHIQEQRTQWPQEKRTKGQTTLYKTYIYKTKDRVTRTHYLYNAIESVGMQVIVGVFH
jgi:hypothetical protein